LSVFKREKIVAYKEVVYDEMQVMIQRNANDLCDHFSTFKFWKNNHVSEEKKYGHTNQYL